MTLGARLRRTLPPDTAFSARQIAPTMSALNKMVRCMALPVLLVAAHGVAQAQNVARWSWQQPQASLASQRAVNDGQWHHVIAEAGRQAGTFTICLDGKQDASGPGRRRPVRGRHAAGQKPGRCERLPAPGPRHAGRRQDDDRRTLRVGVQRAVPLRLHRPRASGRWRSSRRH